MRRMAKISDYVQALSELLKTTPLGKIRINDICKQCGTDRQNFYHYFKDKYELAAWIYKLDYIESLNKNSNIYGEKQLVDLLEIMRSKSDIYINLFDDSSQNSLYSFMVTSEYRILLQIKKEKTGIAQMNDEEFFEIIFNHSAFAEALIAWIRGEYSVPASRCAELMYRFSADFLNKYYGNNEFKNFPE